MPSIYTGIIEGLNSTTIGLTPSGRPVANDSNDCFILETAAFMSVPLSNSIWTIEKPSTD